MILSKIVYDIREGIRKNTDDSNISDEYIIHLINTHRNYLIRNELNNFQRVSPISVSQPLCIALEEVPASECGVYTCETLLKSVLPVPSRLDLHIGNSIIDVRPVLKNERSFKLVTKQRAIYHSGNIKNILAYMDNDNHLYLTGNSPLFKLLQCVIVTGVFEDPTELLNIESCCTDCDDTASNNCEDILDMNYPIPANLIKFIRDEIVTKLSVINNLPNDTTNDATE